MHDTNTATPSHREAGAQQANGESFLTTAQEAISDAFDATVEAVKEHPVAAAAIAAGAAAAVAGAAFGVSKLLDDSEEK